MDGGKTSRDWEPAGRAMRLFTVGHGTLAPERFTRLLAGVGVVSLVDVRTAPGSRRNPAFARAAMAQWLGDAGVEYRWEQRLGGFRRPDPRSPNFALRNDAFRGYADYMRTPGGSEALGELAAEVSRAERDRSSCADGGESRTVPVLCIMCAESVWWRCHRRLVADALSLQRGIEVVHLMHDGRTMPHRLTEGVRLGDDGLVVYDAGQQTLSES